MTTIKVENFGGIIPKIDSKLLPENCAADAINCDLRGRGITPMYAPLFKRGAFGTATGATCGSIKQLPTACYKVSTDTGPSVGASFAPTTQGGAFSAAWATATAYVAGDLRSTAFGGLTKNFRCIGSHTSTALFATDYASGYWISNPIYTVVAGDYLWYSVYLPAGQSGTPGQGCIQLVCTDATTLGGAVNDQNGVSATSGDITGFAVGKWYVRIISLATIVGKSIKEIQFYQNHSSGTTRAAYYGAAIICPSAVADVANCGLFDVDFQQVNLYNLSSTVRESSYQVIDEDEIVLAGTAGLTDGSDAYKILTFADCTFPGTPKQKIIMSADGWFTPLLTFYRMVGRSNHDLMHTAFAGAYYTHGGIAWQSNPANLVEFGNSQGWLAVTRPRVALPAPVVTGGTATDVTRAYVYTRVSEDGLESGPSPAVTKTGKPDGAWDFTGIPVWNGCDKFNSQLVAYSLETRRIYRTPVGSSTYKLVGTLDGNDTALTDNVLDANLGAALSTDAYQDVPGISSVATWVSGIIGGVLNGTTACFCEPYQYHAWPLVNRYTLPSFAVGCGVGGDKFIVLTKNKPVIFSGTSPESMVMSELTNGDSCIGPRGIANTDHGVLFVGGKGIGLINGSGYQNLTYQYFNEDQYTSLGIGSAETMLMSDANRIFIGRRASADGYAMERGAQERGLVKFSLPNPLQAMSYYSPRGSLWIAYIESSILKIGKLLGDSTTKLKWTWLSKLHKTPSPVSLAVAKIESSEWGTLSVEMRKRNLYYTAVPTVWATGTVYAVDDFVTHAPAPAGLYRCLVAHTSTTGDIAADLALLRWVPNNSLYTITITGLTQSEAWCYLKVWADADDTQKIQLVYDNFISSDAPVKLLDSIKSDCWQFEIRGNMAVTSVSLATSEGELNAQKE